MKQSICIILIILCSFIINNKLYSQSSDLFLSDIKPVHQETGLWCWVACGEMIFRYYGICSINCSNDMQCGIISLVKPDCNLNCLNCVEPAFSAQRIVNMLREYPKVARNVCGTASPLTTIKSNFWNKPLTLLETKNEIDLDRPIIAGIGKNNHAVLIIDYSPLELDRKEVSLIINDPYPYSEYENPYIEAGGEEKEIGQYVIYYSDFVNKLFWQTSFSGIEPTTHYDFAKYVCYNDWRGRCLKRCLEKNNFDCLHCRDLECSPSNLKFKESYLNLCDDK